MTDIMIQREAHKNMEGLMRRVSQLEMNDYFNILYGEDSWSTQSSPIPPSEAIIIALFGEADRFNVPVAEAVIRNKEVNEFWKLTAVRSVNKWFYEFMFEAT